MHPNYIKIAKEAKETKMCHQHPRELADLLKIIHDHNTKVYLEIGSYYAGGLWAVRQAVPKATLIGIDNNSLDTTINTVDWVRKYGLKETFIIQRDSQDEATVGVLEEVIDHYLDGDQIDFLFIDGNHYYQYVARDFQLYSPLVRKGGMVAFHDIHPPDDGNNAETFWDEIKGNYKSVDICHAKSWGGVGIITL